MKDLHEALIQQKPTASSSSSSSLSSSNNLNSSPVPLPTSTAETAATETRVRAESDLGALVDDVVADTVPTGSSNSNSTELVVGDHANAELNEVDALIRSVEQCVFVLSLPIVSI